MTERNIGQNCRIERQSLIVCGQRFSELMESSGMSEGQLAAKAGVSEQTVRNYFNSSPDNPHKASPNTLKKLCAALKIESSAIQMVDENKDHPDDRFLADPQHCRKINGTWKATSVDVEIPGFITYKNPIPWNGVLTISQTGNHFTAKGDDKDGDGILVDGDLMNDGSWLRASYWIINARISQFGTAMLKYQNDGKTIEGIFTGRDAGHCNESIGLVVAKITLIRVQESRSGRIPK